MASFTILDVARLLDLDMLKPTSESSEEYPLICPYCGDKKGRASVCVSKNGKIKNTFHCFKCSTGYGYLELYADLTGIHGADCCKKAYWEIVKLLGMEGNKHQKKKNVERKDTEKERTMADKAIVDMTLRTLFFMLPIKEKHKKKLYARGLTDESIKKYMLCSVPVEYAERKALCRRLLKEGCILEGVPSFYQEDNGDWNLNLYEKIAGIICPVFDADGFIRGFQIRLDKPVENCKYIWGSSRKQKNGVSSGSPAIFLGDKDAREVDVTEGILKAIVYHELTGNTVIGTPGIANIDAVMRTLDHMKSIQRVNEYYDMDKDMPVICRHDYGDKCKGCDALDGMECPKKIQKRSGIRKSRYKLINACKSRGLSVKKKQWDFDMDTGLWLENWKGIDDYEWHKKKKGE